MAKTNRPRPSKTDVMVTQVQELIAKNGWAVTGVSEDRTCSSPTCTHTHSVKPVDDPFLYTVGLTVAGLPELLLEHVPWRTAVAVLNEVARGSLEHELTPGQLVTATTSAMGHPFVVSVVPAGEGLIICKIAKVLYGARLRVLRLTPTDQHHG